MLPTTPSISRRNFIRHTGLSGIALTLGAWLPALVAPGNQKKYGSQITGGSSTVRGSYKNLLRIGATAREMLIEVAAKRWKVPKEECYADNGQVIHRPSGKKIP